MPPGEGAFTGGLMGVGAFTGALTGRGAATGELSGVGTIGVGTLTGRGAGIISAEGTSLMSLASNDDDVAGAGRGSCVASKTQKLTDENNSSSVREHPLTISPGFLDVHVKPATQSVSSMHSPWQAPNG